MIKSEVTASHLEDDPSRLNQSQDGLPTAREASERPDRHTGRDGVFEILAEKIVKAIQPCLNEMAAGLEEKLDVQSCQLEDLNLERRVLTKMHEQNRVLHEGFYEREVLKPVLDTLITILDRGREHTLGLKSLLKRHVGDLTSSDLIVLRSLVKELEAYQAELETSLRDLGVEAFHEPGSEFCARSQLCKKCVQASDLRLVGKIAGRLQPGFRRNGKIVREELVSVYTRTSDT